MVAVEYPKYGYKARACLYLFIWGSYRERVADSSKNVIHVIKKQYLDLSFSLMDSYIKLEAALP